MSAVQYALITGASSGIGREFARLLAKQGYGLILVARRVERLQALKAEIQQTENVPIEIISQDLAQLHAAELLLSQLAMFLPHLKILINNAGFGLKKNFIGNDPKRLQEMLLLNMHTLTQLTHKIGQVFVEKKSGFILQVASIAAYRATPGMAVYSATKAYVLTLSEALFEEFKIHGVSVTTVCPGMTLTEFFDVAGQNIDQRLQTLGMSAASVARIGLKALFRKKPVVITGFSNRLNIFALRLLPRWLATKIVGWVVKTMM